MKSLIFHLLTLLLILWIQMAENYFLGASGFSVNVVLIVVLYWGLSRGPMTGEALGFAWGLLTDASTLGLMGLHAFLYAAAGYVAGMLRRQLDERKIWTQTIFTAGISVLYLVFFFILDRIFSQSPHPLSWSMAAQPLANGALAPFFFWLMRRWCQLWDFLPLDE